MRVLFLHNFYEQSGGEAEAVAADRALLEARGHQTTLYGKHYGEIPKGGMSRLGVAAEAFWSFSAYRSIRKAIRDWKPDVAHFHNLFPLISPSGYAACRAEGVPIVQTLHNYRLVCPAATLLRDGKVCELCVGRLPWPAVQYGCYRGSRSQSLVMAATIGGHRLVGTWRRDVDAYIALTEFGRSMFLRGGVPASRLFVRHNAVAPIDPASYAGAASAIFVGRLSPEKGLDVLLDAWVGLKDVPLTIVGEGPLLDHVRERVAAAGANHITVTGQLDHAEVLNRIRTAGMLIFPSICYEGLGYAPLEALALGVPVIASNLGAQAEVVEDGVNGLLFTPGNPRSLANAVVRLTSSPDLATTLARGARTSFAARYSSEHSYQLLLEVYRHVGASALA